jgi:hypothetical protein
MTMADLRAVNRRPALAGCLLAVLACATAGCATGDYRYGRSNGVVVSDRSDGGVVVQYGGPSEKLDRLKRVVDGPKRLFRHKPKSAEDDAPRDAPERVVSYLQKNDLTDVPVFVNHYDPRGQWVRLRSNKRVAAGWRYTLGLATLAGYTLLPDRVFERDRYDPFADTLHINSDSPAVALHEAARAKDIRDRPHPGTYAAVGKLPFVSVARESKYASDVIGYNRAQRDWPAEREAYAKLYPRVASDGLANSVGAIVPFWWAGPVLGLGGAAAGTVAAKAVIAKRDAERELDLAPILPRDEVQQVSYDEPADGERREANEPKLRRPAAGTVRR